MNEQSARRRGRPAHHVAFHSNAGDSWEDTGKDHIDREGEAPLWLQLRGKIEEAIEAGDIGSDDRMPSEQALASMFGVSRPVVRSAIGSLAAEGKIVRIPRRGTFIAPRQPTDVDFITDNLSVFDDLIGKGRRVSTRTLQFLKADASETERRFLSLPEGSQVIRVERVYYSDDVPLTYTKISLAAHKLPGLETMALENTSIWGTIRLKFGLTPQRSERWFKAVLASPSQAKVFEIAVGTPIIAIESIACSQDGAPLEYYDAVFNSQAARIHVKTGGTESPFTSE